jgi:hypothetical protein
MDMFKGMKEGGGAAAQETEHMRQACGTTLPGAIP